MHSDTNMKITAQSYKQLIGYVEFSLEVDVRPDHS